MDNTGTPQILRSTVSTTSGGPDERGCVPVERIDIRKYNIPIDVITYFILKFVKYSHIDVYLTYFGLTDAEREIIKNKIYTKRLVKNVWAGRPRDFHYTVDDCWHREDDLPVDVCYEDYFDWYKHGIRHRDGDLPAKLWMHIELAGSKQGYVIIIDDKIVCHSFKFVEELLKKDAESGSSQLLYLNGNHPRLSNMAVVGIFDGVRILDQHSVPIIDNGPILLCYSWGTIYHHNKYIGKFVNKYFPIADGSKDNEYSNYGRYILMNWHVPTEQTKIDYSYYGKSISELK